jgi:hypothetical protein
LRLKSSNSLDYVEAAADCPLGIILMRLGKAEAHHHAIAQILSHRSVELGDDFGAASVIDANDISEVFRAKTAGEHSRANRIAEQHCDLATLGIGW